jgi:hypothetical protein
VQTAPRASVVFGTHMQTLHLCTSLHALHGGAPPCQTRIWQVVILCFELVWHQQR